jgi:hypothetical protein
MPIDDSTVSSPDKLVRVREMFALPEAHVTAWRSGPVGPRPR